MEIHSFYPVLITKDVAALSSFYQKHFDLELTFESDWYVSLKTKGENSFQLAILKEGHESIPKGHSEVTRGIILNLEVSDANKNYQRLVNEEDLEALLDIRDEPWGQRHFIVADPDDNMIDIIQLIQPSEEFLKQYTEGLQ